MVVTHAAHRAAVRDEVRPGGLRPRDDRRSRTPSPATSSASSTRRPCGSATPCTSATPIEYPPVPSFAPEHFVTASAGDIGRYKQFRRGIEQLDQEGVVQVLRSDLRGDQNPVLAAVGPMQFEVVEDRMTNEFNSPIRFSRLDYQVARRTDAAGAAALAGHARRRGPRAQRRHPPGAVRRPVARQGHRPRQPRHHARGAARRRRLTAPAGGGRLVPARRVSSRE